MRARVKKTYRFTNFRSAGITFNKQAFVFVPRIAEKEIKSNPSVLEIEVDEIPEILEPITPEIPTKDIAEPQANDPDAEVDATDSALALAIKKNVSLADVVGTGKGGRITLRDVEKITTW